MKKIIYIPISILTVLSVFVAISVHAMSFFSDTFITKNYMTDLTDREIDKNDEEVSVWIEGSFIEKNSFDLKFADNSNTDISTELPKDSLKFKKEDVSIDLPKEDISLIAVPTQEDTSPELPKKDDTSLIVDLTIEEEVYSGYNRDTWGSWRSSTTKLVGWKTTFCKWTYYGKNDTPDCMSNVHRDHLVALSETHQSGGHLWSRDKKRDFYNDIQNLYVMHASENIKKSGHDPVDWKPSDRGDWCRYANEWIEVKKKWGLSADVREVDALKSMLATC